jgi:hypothetical protein
MLKQKYRINFGKILHAKKYIYFIPRFLLDNFFKKKMEQKIPTMIISGAGLEGLTLYHALIKNKDEKEFNVKIFERDPGP